MANQLVSDLVSRMHQQNQARRSRLIRARPDNTELQRTQEKPRGLYHISEVLDELLGADCLSALRVVGEYKSENCQGRLY